MPTSSQIERVPVLIAGGGVVGLSASLFLLQHGVQSRLVERHRGTSIHPRARGINTRTAELYREIGVLEEIRTAGAALAPAFGFLQGTSLAEAIAPVARRTSAMNLFATMMGGESLSPTAGCRCTQDLLEPILRTAAEARGGDLCFGTELVDFAQDDDGVTATLRERDGGATRRTVADYLIAADGASAGIRTTLGIPTTGRGSMGHVLNILVQVDLRDLVKDREFSICRIERPDMHALIVSINNVDRWAFHLVYRPGEGEVPANFPPTRCAELLRTALGLGDLPIAILGVLPWEPAVRVATTFRSGRVFLAGDAAHQMPPWGGQGANTGIADAHNLAWKLAAVLHGNAAPTLLDTYDVERRPVGRDVAEKSAEAADEHGLPNFAGAPTPNPAGAPAPSRDYGIRLQGFDAHYTSAAIIAEPQGSATPGSPALDGRPGTRAPHVWIVRDGERVSTLDLFGRSFVLLAGPAGGDWRAAARAAGERAGLGLPAYTIGPEGDLRDPENAWATVSGVGRDGALLVRPDGFVAWRTREAADEFCLARALSSVLERH